MPAGWHPSLTTGDDVIDEQHREILRRLADLVEALERGKRSEVGKLFEFLGDFVLEHFVAEERAMSESAYPGTNVHSAAHRRFMREYGDLRRLYDTAGPTLAIAVRTGTWVQDWLHSHIFGADLALARHLRERDG